MHVQKLSKTILFWYISVWVTLHSFVTRYVAASQTFTVAVNGKNIQSTLAEIYTESMTKCAAYCSSSTDCRFASFNSATNLCTKSATCEIVTGDLFTAVLMKIPVQVLGNTRWYMNPFNGKWYSFERNKVTWQTAQNGCLLKGSKLVKIEDSCEQEWVAIFLSENGYKSMWIGGSDTLMEGTWVWWPDQSSITFTKWDQSRNEPDNRDGDEDCAMLKESKYYKWFDRSCADTYGYICEKLS